MQKKILPLGDAIKQHYEDELLPQGFASMVTSKAFSVSSKADVMPGKWHYFVLSIILAASIFYTGFVMHIPLTGIVIVLTAMVATYLLGIKEIKVLNITMKEYA